MQLLEHVVHLLGNGLLTHAIDAAKKLDVLSHGHVFIQRKALTHVANVLLNLLRMLAYVKSSYLPFAACGLVQSREHVHGSGLSGTVCAQKAKDFAAMNTERNVVNGMERPESLNQMFYLYHIFRFLLQSLFRHSLLHLGRLILVFQSFRIEDIGKLR